MGKIFKMAMKVFLLLTGSAMLFGGGICVATNIFLALPNLFNQGVWLYLILMSISGLIAWAGWGAIKMSGIGRPIKTIEEEKSKVGEDSDAN